MTLAPITAAKIFGDAEAGVLSMRRLIRHAEAAVAEHGDADLFLDFR